MPTPNEELLRHFMAQLEDEFVVLRTVAPPGAVTTAVVAKIDAVLAAPQEAGNWEPAYQIERLLVFLEPPTKLEKEVDRRVSEAEGVKLDSAAKFRSQLTAVNDAVAAGTLPPDAAYEQRQAILTAVIDDLQWFYTKRMLVRDQLWIAADRLRVIGLTVAMVAMVPFFAFVLEKFISKITGWHPFLWLIENMPNYGLYTAISFGLIGAFFSRLIALQTSSAQLTVEDAERLFNTRYILIRAAVGMFGAVIMYFILFAGKDVTHFSILPDFTQLNFTSTELMTIFGKVNVLLPSTNWCILVVWSVLAGFSEKLVPETLSSVEQRMTGKVKDNQ